MNKLSQFLVEQMLLEDKSPIKKVVVVYGGRFQPMHKGHYGTYQHLVKKFGKNNVFISTSNKVERPKSPFNFKEKVKIMTTMFNIPKSKIVQVKNNYAPTEILKKYDKNTTAFIAVVGEKDSNRFLGGKYFKPWKGHAEVGYEDGGYVYAAPSSGGGISGTETRNGLSVGSDDQKKSFFKSRAYGKFNATIFNMITDKLNEGVVEISKERIEEWLINESSKMSTGQVDDGPNFFFPNYDVFSKINVKRAAKIGYEVVNMITSKEIEDYYDHPIYPNGPVKAVTPFPAGVLGTTTATNQIDIYSSDAYSKWFKHVTRKAAMVGYELVKSLASKEDLKQDKEQSVDDAKGDKVAQKEYEASLNEAINLPVEVGDTILMGRFKNKKVKVKTIGKDEHGMPTINGRKVVTFRLMKEGFVTELAGTEVKCEKCNHSWDIEEDDTEKYLCHSCGWDSQQQEYDYAAFDSWQEKMGLSEDVDIDERSKGKLRPADLLRRKAAMAGKKAQIARRRKRTMMRRKPLSKLKKIAYKKAYLQVYDEFRQELFPGIAKKDLSIQQAKIVHKNVLRKKKRVLKRARFRFLPALRDAEAEKFGGKNNTNELMIGYAGPEDMKRFEKRNKEYRKDSESSKEYQYEPIKEQSDKKTQCINNFVEYACKRLKLDGNPKISLMSGTEYSDTHKSLGGFNPQTKEIYVATENRLTADICRTIAHELVHRKQDEMGLLKDPIKDGADGSPIENQAHAVAGIIMREYGRIDDTIYQEGINDFFYMDFKKYVYKNRKQINQKLKGLSYRKKSEFLELLWKKVIGKGFGKDADGRDIQYNLKQDKLIKEGLKELGITDFKSLFKKMPSDLQKRVYNLKNFGQRADKHPEGNVLKHTIVVVNRSIKEDDIDIAIAAMFHDIGKDETAGIHPKKGHITHFGHEKVSASLVKKYKKFIESVGGNPANVFYIVKNHMRYKQLSVMTPKKVNKLKSFRAFDKLGKFSKHDRSGLDENKATRTKFSLSVPSDIKKLQQAFKKNKKQLYVVGGAVRDALLGKKPKDFDLTTDATPEEMIKIAKQGNFKHSTNNINTNLELGSIAINGHEVTTFRQDVGKGRRPDKVVYCDISTDSKRRDLTCNSLYYDIEKKEIIDFHGGVEDMKKGVIRTVGKPAERFDEDPLRKLRAVRFETRMNAKLDKETLDALKKDNNISQLTGDRIMREFRSAIKQSKNTKVYLERCDEIGFTKQILPGLKVSKPYPHDNNYLTFIAFILRDNDPSKVGSVLNKIEYSNNDRDDIKFLISLKNFTPDKIIQFKKLHNNVKKLKDKDIVEFGKRIGKKLDKFVKFKLSVSGNDAPKDLKGPEIGLWLKNQEKEKFMKEIDDLVNDIDKKIVEMFFPTTETPKPINEGGAYGHMSHPFDTDINLTFGQLKDIVNRALEGTLEFTREKTDGQALAISWRDGRLVAARNKGHLKNKGENALDIKGVSDKFQGRGGLSDAYNYAMKDLSNAIKSLNDKQRDKIFKQGACFMNLEVIYPTSVNVIPYGQALLVFHGTMEFNEEGVAIGENGEAARILAGMIKQVNKDVQDNYTIQGPPVVKLPKSTDLSKKRSKYSSQITKLQKEFNLKDTDGVANYHQAWWEQWVDKNSPSTLDNKTKMGLVKRWAFMDKKFRLDNKNITDSKTLEWAKKIDKEDQKKISKQNLMKFEQIFLGLGAEVLEFTSSALTVNPDAAVRDMKKRIDKTIKDVKKSGDPKKIEKLKLELGRLNSIGGSKKIVPNEGIVFLYKGNTFKLTGTFASVNQILGIFF
jgi:tRNA nucleotidyltransferase/poly(A) polymerase